jgi:hypothetical protein
MPMKKNKIKEKKQNHRIETKHKINSKNQIKSENHPASENQIQKKETKSERRARQGA